MRTTSRHRALGTWALGVLAISGLACGGAGSGSIVRQPGPVDFDGVMLDVINDNYYDARIYAVYGGGERHALGSVSANQTVEGLTFPWRARPLAFEVHLVVGMQRYVSHEIDVDQGEHLQLRLPPNLSTSGSFRRIRRGSAD